MWKEIWDNPQLHNNDDQLRRQKSACSKELTPIRIDKENNLGYFKTCPKKAINDE